jgi:hypothetical protein
MKSEPKKAPPRPPSPERERTDVRSHDKTDSERLHEHFKGDRISFTREARRKELESEGNPVLFSADGSEKLFKKVDVGPISHDEQQADMRIRGRGSIVSELDARSLKEMGWNNYMGQNRKRRRKGKQTKKAKKAKKDKQSKKDKKTKKAKKKSSK